MPATATAPPSATCCAACLRPASRPGLSTRPSRRSRPPCPLPPPPRHPSVPGRRWPADRESPRRLPRPTSAEIAARIEELYGAALNDLQAHTQDQQPGMLAALLGSHDQLAFAEQSITVYRERLEQLVHPERQ